MQKYYFEPTSSSAPKRLLKIEKDGHFKIVFVPLALENYKATKRYKMSRQIKLIWDFRGPAAAKTAEHHEIHLKEYIQIEKLPLSITGFTVQGEMQAIAFMVVTDEHMISVRDTLKPHRGELYQE